MNLFRKCLINTIIIFSVTSVFAASQADPGSAIAQNEASAKPIVLAFSTKNSSYGQALIKLHQELFSRLGIATELYHCEPQNCNLYFKQKRIDGFFGRGLGFQQYFPDAVVVKEPVYHFQLAAFYNDLNISFSSLDDLKGTNYRLAIVPGFPYWKKHLTKLQDDIEVHAVKNIDQGFKKLINDEVDIYFGGYLIGMERMQMNENYSSIQNATVFDVQSLYMFLNPEHQPLIEPIAKTLREMRADGTQKTIMEEAFRHIRLD